MFPRPRIDSAGFELQLAGTLVPTRRAETQGGVTGRVCDQRKIGGRQRLQVRRERHLRSGTGGEQHHAGDHCAKRDGMTTRMGCAHGCDSPSRGYETRDICVGTI